MSTAAQANSDQLGTEQSHSDQTSAVPSDLSSCRQKAILIVIIMVIVAYLGVLGLQQLPEKTQKALSNFWFLLGLTVLLVILLLSQKHVWLCLVCTVIWGALLMGPVPLNNRRTVRRTLAIVVASLVIIGGVGVFTNFYASWEMFLVYAVLGLIIAGLMFLIFPVQSFIAIDVFCAFGAIIFSIWTIKDVHDCADGNAPQAALYIFIDLLNLLQFVKE